MPPSLSLLLEKSRKSPDRAACETVDSIQRVKSSPPLSSPRRGGKREGSKKGLDSFVEEMNASFQSTGVGDVDPCAQTVDSRQLAAAKVSDSKPRRAGRRPSKSDLDIEEENE